MRFSLLPLSTITTHSCKECVLQPLPLVCVCVPAAARTHSYYSYPRLHIDFMSSPLLQQKHFALLHSINRERCRSININVHCVRINTYKLVVWRGVWIRKVFLLCSTALHQVIVSSWRRAASVASMKRTRAWLGPWTAAFCPPLCSRSSVVEQHHYIILCSCHGQLNLCLRSHEQLLECPSATHVIHDNKPARVCNVPVDLEEVWGAVIPWPSLQTARHLWHCHTHTQTHTPHTHTAAPTLAALEFIQQQTRSLWNNVAMLGCVSCSALPSGGPHSDSQLRVWLCLFTLQDDNWSTTPRTRQLLCWRTSAWKTAENHIIMKLCVMEGQHH